MLQQAVNSFVSAAELESNDGKINLPSTRRIFLADSKRLEVAAASAETEVEKSREAEVDGGSSVSAGNFHLERAIVLDEGGDTQAAAVYTCGRALHAGHQDRAAEWRWGRRRGWAPKAFEWRPYAGGIHPWWSFRSRGQRSRWSGHCSERCCFGSSASEGCAERARIYRRRKVY